MEVLITGGAGFLAWHTRLRLHAQGQHRVSVVTRETWADLAGLVAGVDAVVHLAGVNRGGDSAVEHENITLAENVADAVRAAGRPIRVVYANSIQAGNGTAYGSGKEQAGTVLRALQKSGSTVVDVRLPNIFGEHGRPWYNSFVATFIHSVVAGEEPPITDRQVGLLHAQDAAQALIDGLTTDASRLDPVGFPVGVAEVLALLHEFHASYETGEFPDLSTPFRVRLFNCYRAALFPTHYPIELQPHSDARGSFVETVRSRGGEGQSSVSSTVPGATRGDHYHLAKIERFAVVSGQATIALRKMFTEEVVEFAVDSARPSAVDMPVGWVHNITNTGEDVLITQFWSHERFRPEAPDTFHHPVQQEIHA